MVFSSVISKVIISIRLFRQMPGFWGCTHTCVFRGLCSISLTLFGTCTWIKVSGECQGRSILLDWRSQVIIQNAKALKNVADTESKMQSERHSKQLDVTMSDGYILMCRQLQTILLHINSVWNYITIFAIHSLHIGYSSHPNTLSLCFYLDPQNIIFERDPCPGVTSLN